MKHISTRLFALLLTFVGTTAQSQTVRQIGGTGYDAVNDGLLDRYGNLYVTGKYQGVADFGNGHRDTSQNGSVDFFVAKYDKNNTCLWSSTYKTTNEESGLRLFQDDNENLYTIIQNGSGGSTTEWGLGQMDSSGKQQWICWLISSQFIANISDMKSSGSNVEFLVLPFNTTYMTLYSYNPSGTLNSTTQFNFPFNQYGSGCIIHLVLNKANGSVVKSKVIQYPNLYFMDARFDNDSILISGGFIGSTQIGSIQLSATLGVVDGDAFLAKIDTAGNGAWVKQYSTGVNALEEGIAGLVADSSKVYFFLSSLNGIGRNDGYPGYYDYVKDTTVISTTKMVKTLLLEPKIGYKVSKMRNVVFTSILTGDSKGISFSYDAVKLKENSVFNLPPSYTRVNSFVPDSASVHILGSFKTTVTFDTTSLTTIPLSVDDGFIFKQKYCFFTPVTPTITISNGVLTSSAPVGNQWYLNSNIIPGATSQTYAPSESGAYMVEVIDSRGCSKFSKGVQFPATGVSGIVSDGISIYPNPNTGKFVIRLNDLSEVSISIYTNLGVKVREFDSSVPVVDLSSEAKGMYIVSVILKEQIFNYRVFVN